MHYMFYTWHKILSPKRDNVVHVQIIVVGCDENKDKSK